MSLPRLNLTSIPALRDNYIWVLSNTRGQCIIVDPGEAQPVTDTIAANQWQPVAILLTHHHSDHVDGVAELVRKWPELVVYGPQETQNKGARQLVHGGSTITILEHEFSVTATPGHTSGHVSYYSEPYLFCGDTMFSGGCGRLLKALLSKCMTHFKNLTTYPQTHSYAAHMNILYQIWPLPPQYGRKIRQFSLITIKLSSYAIIIALHCLQPWQPNGKLTFSLTPTTLIYKEIYCLM